MTNEQTDNYRNQLSIGDKVGTLRVLNHPTSGDAYACIISPELDAILWAAGPLHHSDDPQNFVDNQFSGDMVDNANWLSAELDSLNGWGALTR